MKNHTASCGHKIDDGISAYVEEGGIKVYGVYCNECIKRYYTYGRLLSTELLQLLNENEELRKSKEEMEFDGDFLDHPLAYLMNSIGYNELFITREKLADAEESLRECSDIINRTHEDDRTEEQNIIMDLIDDYFIRNE